MPGPGFARKFEAYTATVLEPPTLRMNEGRLTQRFKSYLSPSSRFEPCRRFVRPPRSGSAGGGSSVLRGTPPSVDLSPASAGKPLVVGRMVYDVEKNHHSICDCVEESVEGSEIHAIQVRQAVSVSEELRNEILPNHFSPLGVPPQSGNRGLETTPDGLCRLASLRCQGLPRCVTLLKILMDRNLIRTKGHARLSDSSTFRE